ncbi:transposase [Streptomyces sp. NPDC127051]|uniref:transposase n=1 Tax=Streptomyces sp. NPDC127051 TaxID=3347119 RepID=UPI00366723AB
MQDREKHNGGCFAAELTGLNTREGWIPGLRLTVRRVKPSGRHARDLTAFEKKTGWKYSITAANIAKMTRIPGSHQVQWLDAVARQHAVVEDQVRTDKALGLRNLPSKPYAVNESWMLTAGLAAGLDAWLRLLTLHDGPAGLTGAEQDTMRFCLYHLPARLSRHARRRRLRIESTWPWASAFTTVWTRLTSLPAVT